MNAPTLAAGGTLDFGALPPEVNSGLMYAGAGSGPLAAAASAWADLAAELSAAASACTEALSGLSHGWLGPAAASMTAAAAPFTAWMQATAGHAAHAAGQAAAAAGAYEAAFAATVPPPLIAENRARLVALIATNLFGQNTPAIAATDAAYAEMWAQDAAAMYRYAGDAASATVLKPLATPPQTTTATAQAGQHAAVAQAASAAAGNTDPTSQLLSSLQNALQGMGLNIMDPGSGNSSLGLNELLNLFSGSNGATPFSSFLNSTLVNSAIAGAPYSPAFIGQVIGDMSALTTVMGRTMAPMAAVAGLSSATAPMAAVPTTGSSGLGTLAGAVQAGPAGGAGVTADVGKANLVRSLSVPTSWTSAAAPASAVAPPVALPTGHAGITPSPVITAGVPAAASSTTSRMVDKAEDEEEDGPVYGTPTRALVRTPAGG